MPLQKTASSRVLARPTPEDEAERVEKAANVIRETLLAPESLAAAKRLATNQQVVTAVKAVPDDALERIWKQTEGDIDQTIHQQLLQPYLLLNL